MTVRQLLRSMDSREVAEWHAYYRLEAEDRRRAELDARARAGVRSPRRRR